MHYAIDTITKAHRILKHGSGPIRYEERIVEASDDGWIDWNGDRECPVPKNTRVRFRMKNRLEEVTGLPQNKRWSHDAQLETDIIAYRPVDLPMMFAPDANFDIKKWIKCDRSKGNPVGDEDLVEWRLADGREPWRGYKPEPACNLGWGGGMIQGWRHANVSTLLPGDYVSVEGLSVKQVIRVAEAFMKLGANPPSGQNYANDMHMYPYIGWVTAPSKHVSRLVENEARSGTFVSRQLTYSQVIDIAFEGEDVGEKDLCEWLENTELDLVAAADSPQESPETSGVWDGSGVPEIGQVFEMRGNTIGLWANEWLEVQAIGHVRHSGMNYLVGWCEENGIAVWCPFHDRENMRTLADAAKAAEIEAAAKTMVGILVGMEDGSSLVDCARELARAGFRKTEGDFTEPDA